MLMRLFLLAVFVYLVLFVALAETAELPSSLSYGAFVDTYYAYDANRPANHERSFTTTAARHNEFNLNLAMLEVNYRADDSRARLALQWGTAVVRNYNTESLSGQSASDARTIYGLDSRTIQEAFVGMRLGENTWIDAGIFYAPIGVESWVSKNNFNYTRALFSDYVPYYNAGVKITQHVTPHFFAELHLVNGWQLVQDDNQEKSLGWKLEGSPRQNLTLAYNGMAGKERGVFSHSRLKIYHNLFLKQRWNSGHETHLAVDVGTTEAQDKAETHTWQAVAAIHNIPLSATTGLAMRAEYYRDGHSAHIPSTSTNGRPFDVRGLTGTLNYQRDKHVLLRTEARYLTAQDAIFGKKADQFSDHDLVLVQSFNFSL